MSGAFSQRDLDEALRLARDNATRLDAMSARLDHEVRALLDAIKAEAHEQRVNVTRPHALLHEVTTKAIDRLEAENRELKAAITELDADLATERSRNACQREAKR